MTGVLYAAAAALAALFTVVSFVHLLYRESLRFRARETPAQEFFNETLEERLGWKAEDGALGFSLLRHTLLVAMVVMMVWIAALRREPLWRMLVEVGASAWLVMLVAGYVAPVGLHRRTSGRWLLPLVGLLKALWLPVRPLLAVLGFLQSLAELSHGRAPESPETKTEEDIEALISAGAEEGLIEEDERKLIESAVAFGDKTVREVMTPRPNIVSIGEEASLEELRSLVIHEQYSRIPIYHGTIDQITGFVHVRDMFETDYKERPDRRVKELRRPILHVPETAPVDDLLRRMQQAGSHMVAVVDEYGNTAGLATMEDLVEEIVGEIRDEHEPGLDVTPGGDGSWVVAGSFDLDGLEDLLSFRPDDQTESTTVGGLVTEWLGHVPQAGEAIERDGIRLQVLSLNERRVAQVRVSRGREAESGGEGTA